MPLSPAEPRSDGIGTGLLNFLLDAFFLTRTGLHPGPSPGQAFAGNALEGNLQRDITPGVSGRDRAALLLLDGSFAVVLLHRDPSYMETAVEAAHGLIEAALPSRLLQAMTATTSGVQTGHARAVPRAPRQDRKPPPRIARATRPSASPCRAP